MYLKCYVQTDQPRKECQYQWDDYFECLYHTKEILRVTMVEEEFERQKKETEQEAKEAAKRAKDEAKRAKDEAQNANDGAKKS
ncbi:hypothetical protein HK104_010359 [Borealophlyctis nickersoniae]|nr:hypothetical protein HK104_010359 [Borealophlyctis nickersoniae]